MDLVITGSAFVAVMLLTALVCHGHSKRISRLERDNRGLFRVLGYMVTGNMSFATIELREAERSSRGLCVAHRKDGVPCGLRQWHDGHHDYSVAPK